MYVIFLHLIVKKFPLSISTFRLHGTGSSSLSEPGRFKNAFKSGAFLKRYGFIGRVNGETASILDRSGAKCRFRCAFRVMKPFGLETASV